MKVHLEHNKENCIIIMQDFKYLGVIVIDNEHKIKYFDKGMVRSNNIWSLWEFITI